MFTNFKRVFTLALRNFYRNKGMSVAAVFILTITTLMVTGMFLARGISGFLVEQVQNKIDITAYFKLGTNDQDIADVKTELLKTSSGIKSIEYLSSQDALKIFLDKHTGDPVFSKALAEVGDNPFLPSLNISTNGDPALYEEIDRVLQGDQWSAIVVKVDFSEKKATIEKIFSITSRVNHFGLGLGIVLILVSVLVVLNTIKLVIDASHEEINTMRIVGASDWFIRAPFVIEGAIFGLISFIICLASSLAIAYTLSPGLTALLPGFSLFNYFFLNIWIIILIQMGFGIGLGTIASIIVVRKYLKA